MNEMWKEPVLGNPAPAERRAGSRAPFRTRLFTMLLLFALVPTIGITLVGVGTAARAVSRWSASSAWERIAASGSTVVQSVATAPLSTAQRAELRRHESELRASAEQARRFDFIAQRSTRLVVAGGVLMVLIVALGASRVAGHLSRQLSRPVDELVGWTGLIRQGRPLPAQDERRGAPEFEVLRSGMRTMAHDLEVGRRQALEAERADAFRESARRFAHELKNPLTPIRFAVERLRRQAPEELRDTVEVLAEEAARLEVMARSFAQFGRLPDGPPADVDVAELVTRVSQSVVPEWLTLSLHCAPDIPLVRGYHEPLVRAVSNILLNAVDASPHGSTVTVTVTRADDHGEDLLIAVRDEGCGIAADVLPHIFTPYVTTKPGGTGLGLAIAQQTVQAHGGMVTVDSTLGAGTTMSIRLPLTTELLHA
jgi:signal transduction histidine kinase